MIHRAYFRDDWHPMVREWAVAGPPRPAPRDPVVVTTMRNRAIVRGVLDALGIWGVAVVVEPLPGA